MIMIGRKRGNIGRGGGMRVGGIGREGMTDGRGREGMMRGTGIGGMMRGI